MKSVTSSSDSEDDEETRKLALAVDPDFLKTASTQFNSSRNNVKGNGVDHKGAEGAPLSKRSQLFDKDVDEYAKPYSLDVTPECQRFIAKQLAKSLEKTLKGVEIPPIQASTNGEDSGIKLFAASQDLVTEEDLKVKEVPRRKPVKRKHKKKTKKSTKSQNSSDSSSSESETEKLKSVAVSADWVFQST